MTVIKSLYQNKEYEGYKHRVHRSKKNKAKDARWKRERRIVKAATKGRKFKFDKRKFIHV